MASRPISLKEYAAAGQRVAEKTFWLNKLSGEFAKSKFYYDTKPANNKERLFNIETFRFTGELFSRIIRLSNESDLRLHMILVAGLVLLIKKYTGNKNVTIGVPVYKQQTDTKKKFVNTVLILRLSLDDTMTFKELLLQVRQTIAEASNHVNYPVELLAEQLGFQFSEYDDFPLFDISVLLENIHDKKYIRHIPHNITFCLMKNEDCIEGKLEYNSSRYHQETIRQIIDRLTSVFRQALFDIDLKLPEIELFSGDEKKKLLDEFNDTAAAYPKDKTIHELFEEQVGRTPGNIAVCSPIDISDMFTAAGCFKKNPYIHESNLVFPFKLLKTHKHNNVIVNRHMWKLINAFNGKNSILSIYSCLDKASRNTKLVIYPLEAKDVLEITHDLDRSADVFSGMSYDAFIHLVRLLFNKHLIEPVGVIKSHRSGINSLSFGDPVPGEFFDEKTALGVLLNRDKKVSSAKVLLLGDTPGTATTGLLYLAAYLRRNGVKAYCRFYDGSGDYASMKKDIEGLLEDIRPEIAAVSMKWSLYITRVLDMCNIIREYSEKNDLPIKIVVGGNTASYYWKEIIKYDCIDYLIRGDGEVPLLKLCRKVEPIPNCVYKKKSKDKEDWEIVESPITYVQSEVDSPGIYLSHLDEILLSPRAALLGTFFIYTHKGCAMNCFYCGGCNRAQRETFNRGNVFKRRVEEVRKDITAAGPFTSTFQFEFDIPDKNLLAYCGDIWEGIDLSGHFCIFSTLVYPSPALIRLVSRTFKYVYWDFDVCSLSERHRMELFSKGLVKPQPTNEEILAFMEECEKYENIEVRLNLITGLPYFTPGDIATGERFLTKVMSGYSGFGELHWARLHAQPGAPIVENARDYRMHSYAVTFEDFLEYSKKNFNRDTRYTDIENLEYPYIYLHDDELNSKVTRFYFENNRKIEQHKNNKERNRNFLEHLTYEVLNRSANRLARILRAKGVGPDTIVGVFSGPCLEMAVAILAVLKAGGGYLPIDPEYPGGRIKHILDDSKSRLVLSQSRLTEKIAFDGEVVPIDAAKESVNGREDAGSINTANLPHATGPGDIVYMIYTSGTTGKPKGVPLEHRNLVNYVDWFIEKAQLTAADKTVLTSSFAFDLGYTSIFTSLLNGSELHIISRDIYLSDERFLNYIGQNEISYLKVTPSLFSILANKPGLAGTGGGKLRLVVLGGEPLNVKDVETMHRSCPHIRFMNHYGPTEATIGCVAVFIDFHRFDEYKKKPVIGSPINNTNVYILGGDSDLLPIGVPGELCISGAGLARGYLNHPELTAEKFSRGATTFLTTTNPLYRTGDLARWLPDGTVEFLGRLDNQVKVRGYRIELGEIESRLLKHPRVGEALVTVKETAATNGIHPGGNKYLCAYVVSKDGNGSAEKPAVVPVPGAGSTDIVSRFREQVAKYRRNTAVESKGKSLSYDALNRYANRVARKILADYDDRYRLSKNERVRYKRQLLLHGWGLSSQEKLKSTTVFVAGAGGGASPTVMQLALAGFGTIRICDYDVVELSNLNRQFLHDETRIGMNKALSAKMTIERINPNVEVIPITQKLTTMNVSELVGDSAVIFDMFDNLQVKFVLSQHATALGIPHIIAAMTDINGYATVFHTPHTPCFHCLFDKKKLEEMIDGMSHFIERYEKNPLPVTAASLFMSTGFAVNEATKILLGFENPAYNRFFFFNQRGTDALANTQGYKAMTYIFSDHFRRLSRNQGFDWDVGWRGRFLEELKIEPDPRCPLCSAKGSVKRNLPQTKTNTFTKEIRLTDDSNNKNRQQIVVLLMNHDIPLAAALIGVLKSGKAYVLPDPAAPMEELTRILEDSETRLILTDNDRFNMAQTTRDRVNLNIGITNITEMDETGENISAEDLDIPIEPERAAYVFYPEKGAGASEAVTVSHENVLAQVDAGAESGGDSHSGGTAVPGLYHRLLTGIGGYRFAAAQNITPTDGLPQMLRDYLQQELPDYMIPSVFIQLDKMPLTPNGKIDRRALPDPEEKKAEEYKAPRNTVEEKLVDIWSRLLGREKETIGIDSNFFDLGGHSLNAAFLVSQIHKIFDVDIPMNKVFESPTISDLSEYLEGAEEKAFFSIGAAEKKEYYALSSVQKRLYVLQQMDLKSTAYNICEAVHLEGQLDRQRLEYCFKRLIHRHESLRTAFELINENPVQKIHDNVEFVIEDYPPVTDSSSFIPRFIRPFNLSQAPLLRVGLVKLAELTYLLIVDMHHIISDGMSHNILVENFLSLYNGEPLEPLTFQYKDYSEWQQSEAVKENLKQQETYWLRELAGELPPIALPIDFPRPPVRSFEGRTLRFDPGGKETFALNEMARSGGGTLFMVLLALYTVFLSKISGQEDIVVGIPTSGRKHADLERIIGMFVNTIPLRNHPLGEIGFSRFLRGVKEKTLAALENQDYPFEDIVEKVKPERDMSRNPLLDVMFIFQNIFTPVENEPEHQMEGLKVKPCSFENRTSKFDLSLVVFEVEESLHLTFEYCTELFRKSTVERFIYYLKEIIGSVTKDPGQRISEIEMIPGAEKKRILYDFNDTGADSPGGKIIHELFENQVEKNPDNTAAAGPGFIIDQTGEIRYLTYKELSRRSDRLARRLRSKSILKNSIIALMMVDSLEIVVSILAVLKSGGAYSPIDPKYPLEQKKYILRDSSAGILLIHRHLVHDNKEVLQIPSLESSYIVDDEIVSPGETSPLSVDYNSNDLAYVIYTSGTTGKPKGVLVEHKGLVNYTTWRLKKYNYSKNDVTLQLLSYCFDGFASNFFSSLSSGGKLLIPPSHRRLDFAYIREWVKYYGVTNMSLVPVVYRMILDSAEADDLKSLRFVVVAGEKTGEEIVKLGKRLIPHIRLINEYGPTENSVTTTANFDMSTDNVSVIGMPISNNRVFIVDKNQHLTPIGTAGELCASGDGLARGYLNRPEWTHEKFIPNPYMPGGKMYKSGDLARWLTDGNIEFMGRKDHQVKIRGFRIELGEIENRLAGHPGIREAAVVCNTDGDGDKRLYAYIVPGEEGIAGLEQMPPGDYLSRRLPEYMVPSYFIYLDKLPLTPTGKLDRKSLPEHGIKAGDTYTAPRDEVERKLVDIWTEELALGKDVIGIDSNFFRLGGHSLKAVSMIAKIHKVFNVRLLLAEVFRTPTIRALAEYLAEEKEKQYTSIQPVEKKEYYALSPAQKRLFILQQMEVESTISNLPQIIIVKQKTDKEQWEAIFKKMIERHESLRTSFEIVGDEPVQKVHNRVDFTLDYHETDREEARKVAAHFERPFDLEKAPLLRIALVKIEESEYVLLVDMHHIIADGVSHTILMEDFSTLYRGETLPPLRLQYRDYAEWKQTEAQQEVVKNQEAYWLKVFEGEIPVLNLPTDFNRPQVLDFQGAQLNFSIDREQASALKAIASEAGATLFMVLLTLYNILLAKLSGGEDIVIGTPTAGRTHSDLEPIIGMFVNTLPIRNYPGCRLSFRDFLAKLKNRTLEAFDNQEYPFEDLVETVLTYRAPGRNPLFDVMFVMENQAKPMENIFVENTPGSLGTYERSESTFDMTLNAVEVGEKIHMTLIYRTRLFKETTIKKFIKSFSEIVTQVINRDDMKLEDIQISHELYGEKLTIPQGEGDFEF